MNYSEKFQALADAARAQVEEVTPSDVDRLQQEGAIVLDIRDKEEHDAGHIPGSLHLSRGKLEMNVEATIPDRDAVILCYCNAFNRGALSANTLRRWDTSTPNSSPAGLRAISRLQGHK